MANYLYFFRYISIIDSFRSYSLNKILNLARQNSQFLLFPPAPAYLRSSPQKSLPLPAQAVPALPAPPAHTYWVYHLLFFNETHIKSSQYFIYIYSDIVFLSPSHLRMHPSMTSCKYRKAFILIPLTSSSIFSVCSFIATKTTLSSLNLSLKSPPKP